MAIPTDDIDIHHVLMNTHIGGNGDWYLTLTEYPKPDSLQGSDTFKQIHFRMATSGGYMNKKYPDVAIAFVNFCREMQKVGLDKYPSGPLEY